MFFDERNCRTFKLLNEACEFLEASLEKLLALEQQALNEINSKVLRKAEEDCSTNKDLNNDVVRKENSKLDPTSTVIDSIGDTCNSGSENYEHKCFYLLNKIKLASFVSEESNDMLQIGAKRKCEDSSFSESILQNSNSLNSKKVKSDTKSNLGNVESVEVEQKSIVPASDIDNLTISVSTNPLPENITIGEVSTITLPDKFFKVCIKFKESLSYETAEELLKSVGIDNVFDLLLIKKKAELTFLNESSMKKALTLTPSALNILKAYSVRPLESQTIK